MYSKISITNLNKSARLVVGYSTPEKISVAVLTY